MRLNTRIATRILLSACLFAFALTLDATAQSIRILRKSGPVEKAIEIVKDDAGDFKYKPAGGNRTIDLESTDVLDVVWEAADDLYLNGVDLLADGEYENAINSLQAMLAKTTDDIFKRYVSTALIRAHVEAGAGDTASSQNQKAITAAEQFLADNDKARLAADVRLLLGRAQMQAGDHDAAEQTFKSLENDARAAYGQDWEVRAKHWGARNLEAKGNFAEAKNLYESLANTAKRTAELATEGSLLHTEMSNLEQVGLVRQGVCLLEDNKLDDAERYYDKMRRDAERAGDMALLGGAHNGLGLVAFRQGDYKKARFQFLLVSVKYFHNPEQTLAALYWIGECFEKLDGVEPGARARATDYYREVVERNKSSRLNSPLAAKAKKKI